MLAASIRRPVEKPETILVMCIQSSEFCCKIMEMVLGEGTEGCQEEVERKKKNGYWKFVR
jgi:hypothetical protein